MKQLQPIFFFYISYYTVYINTDMILVQLNNNLIVNQLTMTHAFSVFQVRDGSTSSSPLLGTFCGVEMPPRLQSSQKSMYIKFKTDSSVSNYGFEAAYGSALQGKSSVTIYQSFATKTHPHISAFL